MAKIAEVKKRTRSNNCRKKGHWANECPEKKEASFKKPDKGKSTSKEVNKSKANAAVCEESESDSSAFMAFVGENAEVNKGDIWYLDDGATNHMSDKLEWFQNFEEVAMGQWPVMIADNRKLWVRGYGDIQVRCLMNSHWERQTIKKVLFIPDLRKNLFLVGQAADKGFTTTYTKHSCYLTSQGKHGRKVLTRTQSNKLYLLDMQVIMPESHANAVLAKVPVEEVKRVQHEPGKYVRLWHKRLGHVHNEMIVHMHNYNMVNSLELGSHDLPTSPCEGCAMGKNSRKTLPKETLTPKADKLGKFFQSDVCGPMSQESYGGARYFVPFKDDCLGYRIVYCVKQKSQVLECFEK